MSFTHKQATSLPYVNARILSRDYWKEAAHQLSDRRMLILAALITAMRVVVKLFKVTLIPGPNGALLSLTFDCYVNAAGSMIYGPVLALLCGAVSDTVGAIAFPSGTYFLPFILVEMTSSFLFSLFFWRQRITPGRVLISKFTVNFVCNIVLNSVFLKWFYLWLPGLAAAEAYNIINLVRIAKNLVLFPLEAVLITLVLAAVIPALKQLRILPKEQETPKLAGMHVVFIVILTLLSVALVVFYATWLREFLASHNIKLL